MNIAQAFREQAQLHPGRRAVVFPAGRDERGRVSYAHYTFSQLDQESDYLAFQFQRLGIGEATKVLLFVRPSLEFALVAFALFKVGAIPVLIDPGMGRRNLINAVKEVEPEILVAVPEVHRLRMLIPQVFRSVRLAISTGKRSFGRTLTLSSLLPLPYYHVHRVFEIVRMYSNDAAAIIYTSGGTGRPKGVIFTHGIFAFQVRALQEAFYLGENDIDLPGFPLFSLFSLAMGVTSVVPQMDPSHPAEADPAKLVETIWDQGVTFAAGSPAIWEKVARYCTTHGMTLPSVRSLVMFGAPVRTELHKLFAPILTNGTTYTPYGATECLPITNVSGAMILSDAGNRTANGGGTCLGWPLANTEVRIMAPRSGPVADESDMDILEPGEVGEIVVSGPQVTPSYYKDDDSTSLAKIRGHSGPGKQWHRMGDLGYLDVDGRLWFCGRKAHRVRVPDGFMDPIPAESAFLSHPEVRRVALIGISDRKGFQRPCIVVERLDGRRRLSKDDRANFKEDLLELARHHAVAKDINTFFLHEGFPVDTRHNIKIDRTRLSRYFQSHQGHEL